MNPPPWRQRPSIALIPLVFVLLGCWPYCQLGGGMTDNSVTVDGEDGTRIEAQAEAGGTAAKLEFVRKTIQKSQGFEVTYVFDKTHISQTLHLILNDSESEDMQFLVSEHDEASSFDSHGLKVSPDGKIVAYRLGARPWNFVHVLTPELAIHDDYEQKKLDFSKVPDPAGDGFIALYTAQDLRLDGTHRFDRQMPLLEWLRDSHGQRALASQLFGLIPEELHNWGERAELLDDEGLSQLADLVRAKVSSGEPHSEYFAVALDMGFVDLDASPDVVRRGAQALQQNERTVRNDGADLAEYLRVYAKNDVAGAAKVACKVVGEKSRLAPNGRPYATDYGRPLAMVSFAVLARAGADCDALQDWEADPCTACNGRCNLDELEDEVQRVLAARVPQPPIGQTPDEREKVGGLIVAADRRSCD